MFDESHIKLAQNFGKENSPCLRRKYGTIIKDNLGKMVFGANVRVGKSCTNVSCCRDLLSQDRLHHSVEVGADIHAEQAALIEWGKERDDWTHTYEILLVGSDRKGNLLTGENAYPCHVCALMIKYAGFKYIWIPKQLGVMPISISEVIEHYEQVRGHL